MALTRIPVSKETRDRLKRLAAKGETYDSILRRLMERVEARMLYEREKRILVTEHFAVFDRRRRAAGLTRERLRALVMDATGRLWKEHDADRR